MRERGSGRRQSRAGSRASEVCPWPAATHKPRAGWGRLERCGAERDGETESETRPEAERRPIEDRRDARRSEICVHQPEMSDDRASRSGTDIVRCQARCE